MITFSTGQLDRAITAWNKNIEDGCPTGRNYQDWLRERMNRALRAAITEPVANHG